MEADPPVLIAGRYRLLGRIGSGGMGHVWHAWDERLSRAVAVKQLHSLVGLPDDEARVAHERAMREARITARLHHPHAVPVFDVVDHDGRPCLVMQYLPSRSLQAVLAERGPLPVGEVARLGSEIASALAAAHRADIVHRDVKPGNVLIAEDGTARITDFGISHALGDASLTSTGMVTGTPAYLAPEVARGASSSPASDVFSLGATLYAASEGRPPFGTGTNAMALLHRVASGTITPPRESALSPVLLRMLATDPADRPTMKQASADLATLAAGRATRDRSVVDGRVGPDRTRAMPIAGPAGPAGPSTAPLPVPATPPAEPSSSSSTSPGTLPAAPPAAADVRGAASPDPAAYDSTGAAAHDSTGAAGGPVQRPEPRGDAPAPPRRRSRALLAAVAVLLVAGVGLAVWAMQGSGADPGGAQAGTPVTASGAPRPSSPRASTTPATSSAESPAPSTSRAPTATTTPPDEPSAPTTASTPAGAPSGTELARGVRGYYGLLPNDTEAGWGRLSDRYRSTTARNRATYESFWGSVDAVEVRQISGSAPDSVEATIRYAFKDGRRFEERTAYTLVREDGVLKIDTSAVESSRQL